MSPNDITKLAVTRPDFAAIAAWIPEGASVLDLGCGDGSLLRYLKETRSVRGYGVEINDLDIVSCIANGVNVTQTARDPCLSVCGAGSFVLVMLAQPRRAPPPPEPLIREMLRV